MRIIYDLTEKYNSILFSAYHQDINIHYILQYVLHDRM